MLPLADNGRLGEKRGIQVYGNVFGLHDVDDPQAQQGDDEGEDEEPDDDLRAHSGQDHESEPKPPF